MTLNRALIISFCILALSNELSQFNYRNIPYDSLHIPKQHGENKSFFAWLNGAGEIEMVFIPEPNKPQYIRNYFLEVKRKVIHISL